MVTLLVFDFVIYLQPVMLHALLWLRCLHQVHHTYLDFDATPGLPFHPLEIFISLGVKMVVAVLLVRYTGP